jgi:hypothetical protein
MGASPASSWCSTPPAWIISTPALKGRFTAEVALAQLLAGSHLTVEHGANGILIIIPPSEAPAPVPTPPRGEDIVVTGTRIKGAGWTKSGAAGVQRGAGRSLARKPACGVGQDPGFLAHQEQRQRLGWRLSTHRQLSRPVGLGPIRTLVLEDGHRVPPTYYDGTTDINTLPQLLVKRVEVAGGASAVYGSDAVSGVVNFILDKDFNGIKGQVQDGISTYGDGRSIRGSIAMDSDRRSSPF